jgi:hypothetical protein
MLTGTAANRGLPQDVSLSDAHVSNVVARELFERCHLPTRDLSEIWDLVTGGNGQQYLERDHFVVGLFIIDQREQPHPRSPWAR